MNKRIFRITVILTSLLFAYGCDVDYAYSINFAYMNKTESKIEVFSLRDPGHSGSDVEFLFSLEPGGKALLKNSAMGLWPSAPDSSWITADNLHNSSFLQDILIVVNDKDTISHQREYIEGTLIYTPAEHNICKRAEYSQTRDEKFVKEYTYTFTDEDIKK